MNLQQVLQGHQEIAKRLQEVGVPLKNIPLLSQTMSHPSLTSPRQQGLVRVPVMPPAQRLAQPEMLPPRRLPQLVVSTPSGNQHLLSPAPPPALSTSLQEPLLAPGEGFQRQLSPYEKRQ